MGPQFDKVKAISFDGGDPAAGTSSEKNDEDNKKQAAKVKPMSKKVSTTISTCSSKMTEILSWQAKLQENKVGLKLGFAHISFELVNRGITTHDLFWV